MKAENRFVVAAQRRQRSNPRFDRKTTELIRSEADLRICLEDRKRDKKTQVSTVGTEDEDCFANCRVIFCVVGIPSRIYCIQDKYSKQSGNEPIRCQLQEKIFDSRLTERRNNSLSQHNRRFKEKQSANYSGTTTHIFYKQRIDERQENTTP